MNCYRFQIAWSRVCPQGDGDFNDEGIAFYDRFINDLIARGIEPMICLYHFDMPLALAQEYNGFNDRRVMDAFIRYGKKMIDCYGDRVKYWLTFNEQNIFHMPEAFRISGYMGSYRVVRALKPNTLDMQHLVCEHSDPVLEVEQVIYLEDGTPLEYAHCHYRYDHGGIVIVNNG